ncbi:hypothetical protein LCGC14_2375810 [marine sediment metagenome]|uniref:Uncharacterized protein n=1 Tax=marine sediment metagenome TaxID=412755 RepID=A0A0F9C2I3_9ZZZZ
MFRWELLLAGTVAVAIWELLRTVFTGAPDFKAAWFTMVGISVALGMLWIQERRDT